ncbi:ANR family transcriptional regulator [Enterobacter ludwigii]
MILTHFHDTLLWPPGTTCNDLFCTSSSPGVRIPRVRTDNRREHHQDHQDENIIMTPHTTECLADGGNPDMLNASERAETAAGLEREGNYGEAARWWRMAADITRNPRQQHWHESPGQPV